MRRHAKVIPLLLAFLYRAMCCLIPGPKSAYFYWCIVRFSMWLDLLHFFRSWTFSRLVSSSSISAATVSSHVLLSLSTGLRPSTLILIFHPVLIIFPHQMSFPSHPATSNDSLNGLNSYQLC